MGNTGRVIEEEIQEGKLEQLWKIGEPDTEGYFTLENSKMPKLLTFIPPCSLRIEGNFQIDGKYSSIYVFFLFIIFYLQILTMEMSFWLTMKKSTGKQLFNVSIGC